MPKSCRIGKPHRSCRVNDNDDPDVTDLTRYNFSWKRNDAHVELAKRAKARGVKTIYPTSIGFEGWMATNRVPAAPEAAKWIMTRIRRWRELGVELQYYSVIGDPYFALDATRLRYFGGSSNHWAG